MNTSLVKSSKAVKGSTSTVRMHLDAVERAREIYLAQIKRAEADYFERITHATAIITGDSSPDKQNGQVISDAASPSEENTAMASG